MNLAAEQFMAVAQIIACDLARSDLYIVPSRVEVDLVLDSGDHVDAERLHDNNVSRWCVKIPMGALTADRHIEDVAVIAQILHEQSLRSSEWPVLAALDTAGLFQNTMVGTHYSTVYAAINSVPALAEPVEADHRFASLTWRTGCHDALSWNTELVEEYKHAEIQQLLTRRYTMGRKICQVTLSRLTERADSLAVLIALRAEGWLDWQLMAAINGVATAWRVSAKGLRLDLEEGRREAQRLMRSEELAVWPEVPLHEFSKEVLERQLEINLISTLQLMKLTSRQFTPNFAGLKQFARAKLRYFADDLEHVDLLVSPVHAR